MKRCFFLILCIFVIQYTFAQTKLVVIKATSKNVSINDGGVFTKNAWSLSPQARPDVFTADRTRETKWVTFYTDMDSIHVKVVPGTRYNFVILLNGKDSCFTRIDSAIPPETANTNAKPDTIPFTLTAYNAICVNALINGHDTLKLHFDISSSGIHFLRDALTIKLNKQKITTLQMGEVVLHNPIVGVAGATAREMDGRFGFDLFEGKQIEVNYDRRILVIHSVLPKALKGYIKSKLGFSHSFAVLNGTFTVGDKSYTGIFSMDTGSEQAMILDSGFAAHADMGNRFKLMHTSILHDGSGKKYKTKIVEVPKFELNRFQLADFPAVIFSRPNSFELNFLGNDIMKRFNMILDLKQDYIYLKANSLFNVPYHEVGRG